MKNYFLSFIAIFVAMDVIGSIPLFLNMTEGIDQRTKTKITTQAVIAGFIVSIVFIFLGKFLFGAIGITIADFKAAGGLLLLIFAIQDLLFSSDERKKVSSSMGVVPIGIPLLVGPAVLTTLILSVDHYEYVPTFVSIASNLIIAWFGFRFSPYVVRLLGQDGSKGLAKVMSLLLAAIGVMMIRSGIEEIIKNAVK
jgi:multiple antibiotic resistance protein